MKLSNILFISSLLGIAFLLLLPQTISKKEVGTIKDIKHSKEKITIYLENSNKTLIIFENNLLNLAKGDRISYFGKEENYKGRKQLIINQINLLN